MIRSSIDEIQNGIDSFVSGIPTMEKEQFDVIYSMLKDLSLDSDGNILPTIGNIKLVGRIKNKLDSIVNSDEYIEKVGDLQKVIEKVTKVQTNYLAQTFVDFAPIKLVPHLESMAFENTVSSLTDAGVNENVVNLASDIVEQHVTDGSSFTKLVDELKSKIVSTPEMDSKLVSYSKQIINDNLSGFSRNYHKLATEDLGLDWFTYIGALVDTSRPFCKFMVKKKYIHRSEFGKVLSENSKEGLMPGTNSSNLIDRCGGYQCTHQLIPISDESVPTSLRRKFEPDIQSDDNEKGNQRPTRKT